MVLFSLREDLGLLCQKSNITMPVIHPFTVIYSVDLLNLQSTYYEKEISFTFVEKFFN